MLISSYVDTMVPMGATNRGLLSVGIVLGVTAINLLGAAAAVANRHRPGLRPGRATY